MTSMSEILVALCLNENIPGYKGGRCVRLTTSPPLRAECHEIWEPKAPGTLWATPGLLRESFPSLCLNDGRYRLYRLYRLFSEFPLTSPGKLLLTKGSITQFLPSDLIERIA